jgi:LPXTG-motif cell wall-anchored protein
VPAVPLASLYRARVSGDVAVMYYVIMGVLLVGLIVLFLYLRKKGQ